MGNSWHLSYDLDTVQVRTHATATEKTIYNRVRDPWLKRGFKYLQNSMYVLEDTPDAEKEVLRAFEELEENDVRRYIKSMILKGPDGTSHDLVQYLDERAALQREREASLRRIVAKWAGRKSPTS